MSATRAKKGFSKISKMYDDHFASTGITLSESRFKFRSLYPGESADAGGFICSQHSYANFKIEGTRNGESVYWKHKPTREEKLKAKIARCNAVMAQAATTKQKHEDLLVKYYDRMAKRAARAAAKTAPGTDADLTTIWDFDPSNTSD